MTHSGAEHSVIHKTQPVIPPISVRRGNAMHSRPNPRVFFVALSLAVALTGCARPDREVCAGQGFVAGTDAYNQCMSDRQRKRAEIASEQEQSDRQVRALKQLSGAFSTGCSQDLAKEICAPK